MVSSKLSADGVPVENITRLVGHTGGSAVTEKVYRLPVIQDGAIAMDRRQSLGQSLEKSQKATS